MERLGTGNRRHTRIAPELYKGFRLNDAIVQPEEGAVIRDGHRFHLPPKSMEVLLYLAENINRVIPSEELLEFAWGTRDTNRAQLSHAISEIRQVLDDHKECPEFIQTFPRKGYRLICTKQLLEGNVLFPSIWPLSQPIDSKTSTLKSRQRWKLSWSLLRSSKLFSVSVAFVLSTWILIQVLEVLFPIFNIPDWGLKVAVLVLVIGFPLTLLFTWLREIRIKRSLLSHSQDETQRKHFYRQLGIDFSFIGLLSVGVGFIAFYLIDSIGAERKNEDQNAIEIAQRVDIPIADDTIALLPLEIENTDFIPDYFKNTIMSELRSVITNHSSFNVLAERAFSDDAELPLSELAKQTGARYFINLKLSASTELIYLNVSLLDSQSNLEIWSQSFESHSDNLLKLQDHFHRKSITALRLLSNSHSETNDPVISTQSFEAYDHYIHGKSLLVNANNLTELEEAEQFFLKALSQDKSFSLAAASLCQTYLNKYDLSKNVNTYAKAEGTCLGLLQSSQLTSESLSSVAELYRMGGDLEQAIYYYQQAIDKKPAFLPAITGLANVYALSNQLKLSEQLFIQAIATEPGYWKNHQNYGDFLFQQGRYNEAIENYKRVIFLHENNEEAINRLGASYYLTNQFDSAIQAYKRSAKLSPSSTSFSNLGTAYFFNHNFDDAIYYYRQAVNLEPSDPIVWGNLGDARKYSGNQALANQAYQVALQLVEKNLLINPSDTTLQSIRLRYQSELNQCESVSQQIGTLSKKSIVDPYFYYDLSLAALNCEQSSEASKLIQTAIEQGYSTELLKQDVQFLRLNQLIQQL